MIVLPPTAAIANSTAVFPLRRIFCVGKNYADHVREMGGTAEPPVFFMKPADAVTNAAFIPYPPATQNLHHEVELVVALGSGGANLTPAEATDCIFGYAVGLDLTRRDLQPEAKAKGLPWDMGKAFDFSAPLAPILLKEEVGDVTAATLALNVNGQPRQHGHLRDMVWSVPTLLAELSRYVTLAAGDLVFTGTPAGVGPLVKGDVVMATITGLPSLSVTIT
jgi:fumarylpyruvate hydrolase